MEETCSPQHRVITPPAPAFVPSRNLGRLRALFTSSASNEGAEVRTSKPSVHYQGLNNDQLDGQPDEPFKKTIPRQDSRDSPRSSLSQRLSDQFESLGAKLNGTTGTQTIVHRASSRQRQTLPLVNVVETSPTRYAENGTHPVTPGTNSSSIPPTHNTDWSPISTASTAATSWTSPRSSGPFMRNHHTPEEGQTLSKSVSGGVDEGFLPPIQEDSGRFIWIPLDEKPIEVMPSVITVENGAAAKVYFETHFHKVLMEPNSPRSLRLKRFEQSMADLCPACWRQFREPIELLLSCLESADLHLQEICTSA